MALNIIGNPSCLNFILGTINKTFNYLNQQALLRGIHVDPKTVKTQAAATQDIAAFILTMFNGQIIISKTHPDYGAHVPFAGGDKIYIDLGYEGPLDLIHETFHLAPYGFSDRDLADALHAPYAIDPRNAQKTAENASTAWDCLLQAACK